MKDNFFSKHVDTVVIVSSIVCSVLWMSTKFSELEKEIAIIKTVLIMKNIYPADLADKGEGEH